MFVSNMKGLENLIIVNHPFVLAIDNNVHAKVRRMRNDDFNFFVFAYG